MDGKAIHERTNEIPVFQERLAYLDVEGKTVTAGAMHGQREACRRILQRKGDYLFGLKENQPSLLEDDCRFLSENAHRTRNALRKYAPAVRRNFLAAHHKKASLKAHMLSTLLDSNLLLSILPLL